MRYEVRAALPPGRTGPGRTGGRRDQRVRPPHHQPVHVTGPGWPAFGLVWGLLFLLARPSLPHGGAQPIGAVSSQGGQL